LVVAANASIPSEEQQQDCKQLQQSPPQDAAMPRLFKTASSFTTPVYQQPGADSAQAQEQQHGNAPAALSGCPVLEEARPAAEAASSSSSRRKRGQQLYQGQHRQLYQGQHRQQQQAQQQL
jgi:hypothetical protein